MKMKELPCLERPYEKLELYGEEKLSDIELLAIIIKSGTKNETALQIAQRVLLLGNKEGYENLEFLQHISLEQLTKIKGTLSFHLNNEGRIQSCKLTVF